MQENISPQAKLMQAALIEDEPLELTFGKRKIKVGRLTNWVALQISKLTTKAQINYKLTDKKFDELTLEEKKEMNDNLQEAMLQNRTLAPKAVSLLILRSTIKVALFHKIYWRYLHLFKSQHEYTEVLLPILSAHDYQFFFQNLVSLQMNNTLEIEAATANTRSILQKQKSQESPTS